MLNRSNLLNADLDFSSDRCDDDELLGSSSMVRCFCRDFVRLFVLEGFGRDKEEEEENGVFEIEVPVVGEYTAFELSTSNLKF